MQPGQAAVRIEVEVGKVIDRTPTAYDTAVDGLLAAITNAGWKVLGQPNVQINYAEPAPPVIESERHEGGP